MPAFSGGDGSAGNPYLISNAEDLDSLMLLDSGVWYAKQTQSFIMSNREPIGIWGQPITLYYNGQGYGITLALTAESNISYSLFGTNIVLHASRVFVTGSVTNYDVVVTSLSSFSNTSGSTISNCLSSINFDTINSSYGTVGLARFQMSAVTSLYVGTILGDTGGMYGCAKNTSSVVNSYFDSSLNPSAVDVATYGMDTALLKNGNLPAGFSSTYWTKRATPSEAYPYSYPELIQGDIDMAITKNSPTPSRARTGQVGLLVNATTEDCTGNEEIVAAPGEGKRIAIKRFTISSATATNFTLNAATTALLGPYLTTTGGGLLTIEFDDSSMPSLPLNTSLNMDAAGSGVVTITAEYDIQGL
jgi:hypothetical protein